MLRLLRRPGLLPAAAVRAPCESAVVSGLEEVPILRRRQPHIRNCRPV